MDEKAYAIYRDHSRKTHNEEFVRRLLARRPYLQDRYDERVKEITNKRALEMVAEAAAMPKVQAEALGIPSPSIVEMVNETIVFEERPVLFIKDDWIDTVNVTKKGVEAEELVAALEANRNAIELPRGAQRCGHRHAHRAVGWTQIRLQPRRYREAPFGLRLHVA